MLIAYQSRQNISLETACDRERSQLRDKINIRRGILEQKVP
jgi:hypothetical protein